MLSVFPAPAGINRRSALYNLLSQGVPRASGDKPAAAPFVRPAFECSPRQRG